MKLKLKLPSANKLWEFVKQYKFVLIVLFVGVIILALPVDGTGKGADKSAGAGDSVTDFSVDELESELSEALSRIYGAGEVTVMLTVSGGTERIYATNREQSTDENKSELREETVIISTGNGEEAVLIRQNNPSFRGALVVCPGGDDPNVVLLLTKALSSLTGLSSNRITVCKSA